MNTDNHTDMYYGGSALRDIIADTDTLARAVALASIAALGLGAAAACCILLRRASGKEVCR